MMGRNRGLVVMVNGCMMKTVNLCLTKMVCSKLYILRIPVIETKVVIGFIILMKMRQRLYVVMLLD